LYSGFALGSLAMCPWLKVSSVVGRQFSVT
jgi:hypothetical protein